MIDGNPREGQAASALANYSCLCALNSPFARMQTERPLFPQFIGRSCWLLARGFLLVCEAGVLF